MGNFSYAHYFGAGADSSACDAQLCIVGRREVLVRVLAAGPAGQPAQRAGATRRAGAAPHGLPASANLQDLTRVPLVRPVPPNAIRNLLDEVALRSGVSLNILLEGGSSVIIKRMLRDHHCASVLPAHAVAEELARGELAGVPLAEWAFRQHVVLATSSQRPFTLAGKALARLISEMAADVLLA